MAKTVLNVKTDVDVKRDAQNLAKKLGVPLSIIVNAHLKRFISDGKIEFLAYTPSPLSISDIRLKTEPIFKKHNITQAQLFGSYARGDARGDSDVDFLVRYGKPLGLWDFMAVRNELAEALGRDVDVVSEDNVIPYFRDSIYQDLKPLYEG